LHLAALSLRGQDDAAGFVAAFTGSHRYVLDYLTEEVLERQSEQVRTFLLKTSVLGGCPDRCPGRRVRLGPLAPASGCPRPSGAGPGRGRLARGAG
jgi:hypothetical protein